MSDFVLKRIEFFVLAPKMSESSQNQSFVLNSLF